MSAKNIDGKTESNDAAARADKSSSRVVTIVTYRTIAASTERVWSSLCLYEDLEQKPPFLLQLLLPCPLPTGMTAAQALGDETTVRYEDGRYAKRVTQIDWQRRYEFEVIDQRLVSDRGVMLLSGAYTLREVSAKQTDLAITTRYTSRVVPRWIAEPIEAYLCRRLHRHSLDKIQSQAESFAGSAVLGTTG